jgi:hypothetical protein
MIPPNINSLIPQNVSPQNYCFGCKKIFHKNQFHTDPAVKVWILPPSPSSDVKFPDNLLEIIQTVKSFQGYMHKSCHFERLEKSFYTRYKNIKFKSNTILPFKDFLISISNPPRIKLQYQINSLQKEDFPTIKSVAYSLIASRKDAKEVFINKIENTDLKNEALSYLPYFKKICQLNISKSIPTFPQITTIIETSKTFRFSIEVANNKFIPMYTAVNFIEP